MIDAKPFKIDDLKPFYAGTDQSKLANVGLRLAEGRTLTTRQRNRRTAELNRRSRAAEQIGRLPARGESLHCILNGEFALFDFIPAVITLTGAPIEALTVATLGFSKANVEALSELVDAGQIERVAILCSHYFSAADTDIYSHMVELCRRHKFPIAAMRTHAKLLLMHLGKRRLVVESSANLRSCHNCEQAVLYDDRKLYRWHSEWIHELLEQGAT